MVCALCKKPEKLRNSHIIPESFYVPAYDEKHRIGLVEAGNPEMRLLQKGIRETLLCDCCEQMINTKYEQPVNKAWPSLIPEEVTGNSHLLSGANYPVFKLLHLSILWRASLAIGEVWSEVSLGTWHEERLRTALLTGNSPPPDQYPLIGNVLLSHNTKRPCYGWVMAPTVNRMNASRVYSILYGGCLWHTVVASHTVVHPDNPFVLSKIGEIGMPVYDVMQLSKIDIGKQIRFRWKSADSPTTDLS